MWAFSTKLQNTLNTKFQYFILCERSRWLDVGQVLFAYLRMTQGEVWVDKNAKKCGQFLAILAKEAW